jgi:hypothetical protein
VFRSTIEKRFWSKVVNGPECWLWTGRQIPDWFRAVRVGRKMRQAHRVAWELTYGSPPPALLRGTCGNLECVRSDPTTTYRRIE